MYNSFFTRFIPARAFDDRTASVLFDALHGAHRRAERGAWAFLDLLHEAMDGFNSDPIHRVWTGALLDVRSRALRDPDLNRDQELSRVLALATQALEILRQESLQQSRSHTADDLAAPTSWVQWSRLGKEGRLVLQGLSLRAAEREFGALAADRLTQSLAFKGDLRRVLNVSDRFDPRWAATQSFAGGSLAPAMARGQIRIEELINVDIALRADESAEAERLAVLRSAWGDSGLPRRMKSYAMDVRRLGFPEHSFDAIVSHGVLDHLIGHDLAMDELLRVATSGALIFISGHHLADSTEHWMHSIGSESHFDLRAAVSTSAGAQEILDWARRREVEIVHSHQWPHAWVVGLRKGN